MKQEALVLTVASWKMHVVMNSYMSNSKKSNIKRRPRRVRGFIPFWQNGKFKIYVNTTNNSYPLIISSSFAVN